MHGGLWSDLYDQRWLGIVYLPRDQPTLLRKETEERWRSFLFTLFVLFFKDCNSSSGITNLRHTYGPLHIRLEMNTFCFKQIDGLLAKILAL